MARTRPQGSEARAAWLFLSPAAIVFGLFLILPLIFTLFISTSNWNGITPVAQQGNAARGQVTLENRTQQNLEVPAGTLLASSNIELDGITYETLSEVEIAPGTTVEVSVAATPESIGKAANIGPNQIDTVLGDLDSQVIVSNPSPIQGGQDPAFDLVGADNYENLLLSEGIERTSFSRSLANTLYYVIGVVPIQTLLAMVLAIIVNQQWLRGRGFFRTAFYLPSVTSSVVISLIFMFMFSRGGIVNGAISTLNSNYEKVDWLNNSSGLIHLLLSNFGITKDSWAWTANELGGLTFWDWMSGPSVTMSMIMVLNIWTTTGSLLVIYLAALQGIPASVYEAAAIDGARWWSTLKNITIPLLRPTTYLVITIGLISTFQIFDQVFVITEGGPANTTVTIGYIIYQNAFQRGQMGLAAASAIVLFLIIFVFALIQRRITSDRGH